MPTQGSDCDPLESAHNHLGDNFSEEGSRYAEGGVICASRRVST